MTGRLVSLRCFMISAEWLRKVVIGWMSLVMSMGCARVKRLPNKVIFGPVHSKANVFNGVGASQEAWRGSSHHAQGRRSAGRLVEAGAVGDDMLIGLEATKGIEKLA